MSEKDEKESIITFGGLLDSAKLGESTETWKHIKTEPQKHDKVSKQFRVAYYKAQESCCARMQPCHCPDRKGAGSRNF